MRFGFILLVVACMGIFYVSCGGDDHDEKEEEEEGEKNEETEHGDHSVGGTDPVFPPPGYDTRESGIHGAAQHVKVTVYVEAIVDIDVSAMEYVLHGYVIQEWHDARLKGVLSHPMILSKTSANSVWLPDIFCLSCRSSTLNSPDYTNVLIKVNPNGDIYYSQLAKLHSSCYMKLHDFPFDQQICPLNLSSYGYNTNYLIYSWKSTPLVEKMQLEQFTVSDEKVKPIREWRSYPAGNYTILSFEMVFSRQVGFYILQVYLPCAILVSLSWMTFYMEAADIGDRLSIGVTLILTMIFLLGYINQSLPKVSYIKAVDWYVIASLFMIVSSVLESVFVYWLLHRKKRQEDKEDSFDKFDRYLETKLVQSSFKDLIPLISNSGVSLPNIAPMNSKPFRPTYSVNDIENSGQQQQNGRKASFDNDDVLCEEEESIKMVDKKEQNKLRQRQRKQQAGAPVNKEEQDVRDENLRNMSLIVKLDITARVLFPLSYIVFAVVYAIVYLKDH